MPACGYEFYLLVFNSTSHQWVQRLSEIWSWTLEDKLHIHVQSSNIRYISLFGPIFIFCTWDWANFWQTDLFCIGNHTVLSSIWNQFAQVSFSKSWKTHKFKLIPNWTRKTVSLLIDNINVKKFVWRMFWTLQTLNSPLART